MEHQVKATTTEIPERMLEKTKVLKQELIEVYEDVKYQGNCPYRRVVFLPAERKKGCLEFIDWALDKYERMLKSPRVEIGMLVGTLNKQSAKLAKEIEAKSSQISFLPDIEKEIEALKVEKKRVDALIEIAYKGKAYFEWIYHSNW